MKRKDLERLSATFCMAFTRIAAHGQVIADIIHAAIHRREGQMGRFANLGHRAHFRAQAEMSSTRVIAVLPISTIAVYYLVKMQWARYLADMTRRFIVIQAAYSAAVPFKILGPIHRRKNMSDQDSALRNHTGFYDSRRCYLRIYLQILSSKTSF